MENIPSLATYLRQIPFMRDLPVVYRQELASILQVERYTIGEVIIPQGFITDRFFIVAEGRVNFRQTDQQGIWHSVGNAGPGQHFGLAMFTTQAISQYKIEALTNTTLYVMERDAFDELIESQPNILKAMRPIYTRRLELTRGFAWLTPGEEVMLTTHRHWFSLVESLILPVAAGLILVVIGAAVSFFGLFPDLDLPLLFAIPGLAVIVWIAYSINDYVDDDFIVTNKRVAHIERVILKKELRNQIPNDKIQAITVRKVGTLASALKISDLEIRSAGREDSRIVFDRVARAELIRETIMAQRANLRARDEAEMRRRFRDHVERDLAPYILQQPPEEGGQEVPKARPRRSWGGYVSGTLRRMFGDRFVDGSTITYRKHWIALARQAGRWILLFIVLAVALVVYLTVPVLQILPLLPTVATFAFLFLVDLSGLVWQWEDWRNDIYQLTNAQIVDIERLPFGLFSRSTEALLSNVQDARALRPRAVNTILNYGNVEVQTAGGGPPLTFYEVSTPEDIVEEVFRRMEAHRVRVMEHQMVVLGQQVTDALIAYDHMKEKRRIQGSGASEPQPAETEGAAHPSLPAGTAESSVLTAGEAERTLDLPSVAHTLRDGVMQEFSSIEEPDDTAGPAGEV